MNNFFSFEKFKTFGAGFLAAAFAITGIMSLMGSSFAMKNKVNWKEAGLDPNLFLQPNRANVEYLLSRRHVDIPKLPADLTFAGERVPLEQYDVRERLERELLVTSLWHSKTIQVLKLAPRYLPFIESILAKYGIPDDFKFMVMAESGFLNVSSPAGAKGMWQLMEGTAKENGLEINDYVDERLHLEKSTEVACQYIKSAYNDLGSWSLAAASYNMGRAGVRNDLNRQGVSNFFDLYLNTETSRYVFVILSFKEIYNNPEKYGFAMSTAERYQPIAFNVVAVNSIPSITNFAKQYNTTYKNIKLLNPWLRDAMLPARAGKVYEIKIPLS